MYNPYTAGQPGHVIWERMMALKLAPGLSIREREDIIDLCYETIREQIAQRGKDKVFAGKRGQGMS